jgi:penicillin-binding protein 1A
MKKMTKKEIYTWAAKIALGLVAAFVLLFLLVLVGAFGKMPSKKELAAIRQENASLVFAEDGVLIGKYFAQNRTTLDSAEIPEFLIKALVATEDKRFYEHNGIDGRSYMRVLFKSILMGDGSSGGGSTITQQLVKNLLGRKNLWILSMPVNKMREAIMAKRIEKVYTKHQILVLYFNTVPFGENTWGIEAASQRYFNTRTEKITEPQAALLVGMLKANTAFNPRLYPERAVERRNVVLSLMHDQEMIDDEKFEELKNSELQLDYTNYERYNPSGYFVEQVKKEAQKILEEVESQTGISYDLEKDGLEIYTTLNYRMQVLAVEAVKAQLIEKQKSLRKELANSAIYKDWKKKNEALFNDTSLAYRHVFKWEDAEPVQMTKADSAWHYYSMLHASVYAIHPTTGEVKVWVGGNHYRQLPYDLVTSKRQSASAFKPIMYAAALENNFSPCDYLSNEETSYAQFDNWRPTNYDNSSGGRVAMWYALSQSLNIPTVDLYMQVGHQSLKKTADAMGLPLPKSTMPALALGTHSFSLQQMVKAYGAFASGGFVIEPTIITEIVNNKGEVVYSRKKNKARYAIRASTAGGITDMLVTAVNEGTGKRMKSTYGIRSTIAGKTGTSQNNSDAWFICYNSDLVCGVWVGAMSPQVHFRSGANGSGSALALPIAGRMLKGVQQNVQLRQKYFKGIDRISEGADSLACPPYEPEGGFFHWLEELFEGEETTNSEMQSGNTQNAREEKGLRNVLNKVFKKRSS